MAKAIKSLELIQSYIFTTARYNFSAYEKRILYCVLERLQEYLRDKKLNEKYTVSADLFGNESTYLRMTIPLKNILEALPSGEEGIDIKNKNHAQVKKALWSLRRKDFEYIDEKKDTERLIGIIEKPEIKKRAETLSFELDPVVINAFLNFAKGYRKYVFNIAMSLESVYAMRFYELFSNKMEPITYSISSIKDMFQIKDKTSYNKISNFKAKILDPARKELDEKAPFSFSYKMLKTGRKETHILFTPYKIAANQPPDIEAKEAQQQLSPYWLGDISRILKEDFDFLPKEIKNNRPLFEDARNAFNLKGFLLDTLKAQLERYMIEEPALIPDNLQGWVINAIRKKLGQLEYPGYHKNTFKKERVSQNPEVDNRISGLADKFNINK